MPFDDHIPGAILLGAIGDGVGIQRWTHVDDEATETESGWDTLVSRYYARAASATLALAMVPKRGDKHATLDAWVTSREPRRLAGDVWEIMVRHVGLLSPRGHKISVRCMDAPRSVQLLSVDSRVWPQAQVHESTISVVHQYIAIGEIPPTSAVSRPATPPDPIPAIAETAWASLARVTHHWPHGWILSGRDPEYPPGVTNAALVTDTYTWIQENTP